MPANISRYRRPSASQTSHPRPRTITIGGSAAGNILVNGGAVAVTGGSKWNDRADGDTSANAFMFNALYMFDSMGATGAVRPYFGGGIGGANVEVSAGGQDFEAEMLLAYQLIGGVSYELSWAENDSA